ncbi:swr complex subunit [Savitreella phatthalungensis]
MSSADILDALGGAIDAPSATKKVKMSSGAGNKAGDPPTGMARELYSLLGDNTPPVVTLQSRYKEKPRFKQKAARWSSTPFTNPARSDALVLKHWTRGVQTGDSNAGTSSSTGILDGSASSKSGFASFDKHVDVVSYTSEEYSTYCDRTDWTKQETDKLMELCRDWDLRFIVIHDIWETSPDLGSRTLEELKDRYYQVARALLGSRGQSTEGLHYDLQRETQRRQYVEELFKRTAEEVAEENRLILEVRKLEAYEKAVHQQKADLLRLLDVPQAQGSIAQYQSSQGIGTLVQTLQAADKQKHKKRPSEAATPIANGTAVGAGPVTSGGSSSKQQRWRRLSPREERERGVGWHEKLSNASFLRSQKILVLKQTVANKVAAVMQELGLSNVLTMPTERTVRKFDQLQQKIGILLEAKRVCDKLENSDGKDE